MMKKLVFLLAIGLSFMACDKEISNPNDLLDQAPEQSSYKVIVDGEVFDEHSPNGAMLINGWVSTGNKVDFTLTIFNAPEVGQTETIDYLTYTENVASNPMVQIMGDNVPTGLAMFYSGTISRVTKYRIEFEGVFKELYVDGTEHTCEGFIEVEAVTDL